MSDIKFIMYRNHRHNASQIENQGMVFWSLTNFSRVNDGRNDCEIEQEGCLTIDPNEWEIGMSKLGGGLLISRQGGRGNIPVETINSSNQGHSTYDWQKLPGIKFSSSKDDEALDFDQYFLEEVMPMYAD